MRRVSVDIGGTFTDCFLVWDAHYVEAKALTTHHNLAVGFREALESACDRVGESTRNVLCAVDSVRYATTLGTNALIERKGPTVGLLVTAGYESMVPLSRARGYGEGLDAKTQGDLPSAQRPEPVVPIPLIRGVRERMDAKGNVLMPLDEEELRRSIRDLVDRGARAFVVSLVNSVSNPAHELRIQQVLLSEYPSHFLGSMPIVLSHLVVGRKGEYVRTTSAILDAFLHDEMYHGLSTLELSLREDGYSRPMLVVHNSGGMAQLNSTAALQTIHSGPVAGIGAGEHLAAEAETGSIVCTDMGGTSFDIGLVVEGGARLYDFNPVIERWLVSVPMMHLVTLGAGGGSIVSYDPIFRITQVGPASAGSDPGPACYDRGGRNPTVTDADLLLGYLDADNYAGGHIKLNRRRSERAMRRTLAEPLGVSEIEAAKLVKQRVDANMANGIAEELRHRGYAPHNFSLLAYGGNGPLHACGIANLLGVERIIAPPFAPIFSAVGAGNMSQLHIHEKTVLMQLYDSVTRSLLRDFDEFNQYVEALEIAGREDLLRQEMLADAIRHELELDMRYGNQLVQTTVQLPKMRVEKMADVIDIIHRFSDDYGARFGAGSEAPEAGIRIDTIRVSSYVEHETIKFNHIRTSAIGERYTPEPDNRRDCHYSGHDQPLETAVYQDTSLRSGAQVAGPAIIVSPATTYLVEPGWRVLVGEQGSVWYERAEVAAAGGAGAKQTADAAG
ncbi:MAG: hydantoinase/oxoprolinase family protein [Salinisphaera sp.]|nr:hydantoinase/oxoprolinase family protein [Salinisphaera sp.]